MSVIMMLVSMIISMRMIVFCQPNKGKDNYEGIKKPSAIWLMVFLCIVILLIELMQKLSLLLPL